ncbi:hypothetical protein RF55_11656 [Lasius niger]|uniref:Tudor domain-containing protein n=1 Tax=Lasius niger TaxID=67767 RepID=A0A0J7KE82_LASNI|nr:hypothetical protein RF55_11656 [Lasius niger]
MEVIGIDTGRLTKSRLEVTIIRVISPLLFWIQLSNSEKDLQELQEELDFRMARRRKYLHCWPEDIKEEEDVVVKDGDSWKRGWIEKINKEKTIAKICLGDYGRCIWCPTHDIYYLENRFRQLPWQAVACGLAYTGSVGRVTTWPEKTQALCRLIAEGHKGWVNIVHSFRRGAALVKLQVQGEDYEGLYNLRDVLVKLGHAQLTTKLTVDVYLAV